MYCRGRGFNCDTCKGKCFDERGKYKDKRKVVEKIEKLIDKAVNDFDCEEVDWILKRVVETCNDIIEN